MKKLFTLLLFVFIGQYSLCGQCNPAAGLTCEEAGLSCSLNELDGFSCTTLSTSNPTGPNPLCNGSGEPNNTQWWAFKGNDDVMTLTFNIDMLSCSMNKGIEAGVLLGCGGTQVACNTNCNSNSFSLSFSTYGCGTYYLWVDGCEGDICDFDIQVTNGDPRHLPSPLEPLSVYGDVKAGCEIEMHQPGIEGYCWYADYTWTLDGKVIGHRELYQTIQIPINAAQIEVCLELIVGEGSVVCDEATNCITLFPEPIQSRDDGEIFICWEDHKGVGYTWRDTLIYSSCINPPCKVFRGEDDCVQEYSIALHILEERAVKDVYSFICDKADLPLLTEDGGVWDVDACCAEIFWIDKDYHLCDTSYNLYLEIFDPIVSLTQSCPTCNDSTVLKAEIKYFPDCTTDDTYWTIFWLNESMDTVGIGDSIIVSDEGKYEVHLFVYHSNGQFGSVQTCVVHDTSWHINVQNDLLSISGDSLICQKDTSEFFLPNAYSNGCEILWTIEDLDGEIITLEPETKSKIEVYWPTDNTTDGKICAEIIDACDSVRKVCRTLEGCVTTQNNNTNKAQWKVFPNPARDVIYIEGDLNELDIKMHDLHGNDITVQPKRAISGAISIDVDKLSSGVYFILLSEGDKSGVFKLLIL